MLGCIFQASNNASFSNAENLYTVAQIPEADKYTTFTISSSRSFRYVRCLSPNQNCNLAELEFYTDEGEQTPAYPQLTNLPAIYIETNGNFDFVNKENYVPSKIILSNEDSVFSYDAAVKGRGNSTWDFMDKKSIRIKLDSKQHFLGLPANAKNWVLIACAVDKTFLRNGLAFEISKFLDFEFTPACVYADVILDGFYYGTYFVSDHLEVNKNRINLDEMSPEDIQLPGISGGYHLEIDAYAELDSIYFRTARGVPFSVKSPDSEDIVPVQLEWIKNHINLLEDLLHQNPDSACKTYIDLESAVKYYLLSELTGNCDSYWCVHCYKKRGDNRLYFGPVWDYDQAFLTNERVPRFSHTLDTYHGVVQNWFRFIMQTEAAQKILIRLWKKVMEEDLKEQLLRYVDENASLLQQSQALNFERWNSLDRKVWFEDALFGTYGEYILFVKDFIEDRFNWYNENIPQSRTYFLPSSSGENPPQSWQYTLSRPDDPDWFSTSYNDSEWLSGQAPFGTERNLQNTLWDGNEIYIRNRFHVNETDWQLLDRLYLLLFHDEDCLVYINGEPVLERSGYITDYQYFEIDKNHLRPDWNTIAAQCVQTVGGQLIDVGVYGILKEDIETLKEERESGKEKFNYAISDGILTIHNAETGTYLEVYSIEGKLLSREKTLSPDVHIRLLSKGIYLIRHSGRTVKVKY
jgi:hypothetical protein